MRAADSIDVATLVDDYLAAGGGTLAGAAVLRAYYVSYSGRLDERGQWLSRSAADPGLSQFGCYFRLWQKVLDRLQRDRDLAK